MVAKTQTKEILGEKIKMDELNPCPICGEQKRLEIISQKMFTEYGAFNNHTFKEIDTYHVKCFDIEQIKYYPTEQEAIEAWNTRA